MLQIEAHRENAVAFVRFGCYGDDRLLLREGEQLFERTEQEQPLEMLDRREDHRERPGAEPQERDARRDPAAVIGFDAVGLRGLIVGDARQEKARVEPMRLTLRSDPVREGDEGGDVEADAGLLEELANGRG